MHNLNFIEFLPFPADTPSMYRIVVTKNTHPGYLELLDKLRTRGYVLEMAGNVEEVEVLLNDKSTYPDLILLAPNLPSSHEGFCSRINGNPLWENIPVIFVNGD